MKILLKVGICLLQIKLCSCTPYFIIDFLYKIGERQRFMGLGPELTSANAWLQYNINRPFVFIITNPSSVVAIGKFMG